MARGKINLSEKLKNEIMALIFIQLTERQYDASQAQHGMPATGQNPNTDTRNIIVKIVLIGASGIIGQKITEVLKDHEVIKVGRNSGDYQADIEDRASLEALFEKTGQVDAVISAAGMVAFAPIDELAFEQIQASVNSKLLGNINVFQVARKYVKTGGSITLSSGVLAQQPMVSGAAASLVNAALDSFAKAAALELGDSIRINTVSPRFVKETMELMGMDSGSGISAADTAKAYHHAVTTRETGQAFDVLDYL